MLATLPPLPDHIRALSDTSADRMLHYAGVPRQNGLDDCLTCLGTKRFRWYADPAKPQTEDQIVEYECNCRTQFRLSRKLFSCGLGPAQARYSWGDTQYADERDQAGILSYAANFEGYLRYGTGLFLCNPEGPNRHGNGKSMFSALLLKQAISLGKITWFTTFQRMLDAYTSAWGDKELRVWFDQTVRSAEFLVIDDVGQEHENYSPARSALDSVFRTRVQGGLTTIITTNLSQPQFLERYNTALGSLVNEACDVVQFMGGDFRPEAMAMRKNEIKLGLSRPWTLS